MIKFHIKPPGIHIHDGNLIEEVSRRVFLYDTKSSDYRNLPLRAIVWDEIAKTLNVDDQSKVQKRWKVLREKFATAYRKEISEGTTCTWALYEKLRFLESFINLTKNDSKVLMHSSNESLQSSSLAKKSPLDEHALIGLIKQHPVIYNKKHDDFHSSSCRRRAWETISSKLKFDVSILQKRWRVIRDRFVRELRRTQYNDESNLSCSSFFRDMLFLARHIRSKNYAVEAHLENEVKISPDDEDNCNDDDNDEDNNEWILQQDDPQQDNVDDDTYQFIEETEDIEQVYEEEEITQSEYIDEESETEMITINAAPIEEIEAIHENWEKSEANSSLKRRVSVEENQDQPERKKRMKSQSPVRITEVTDKDEDLAFGNTIGCMLKKIPQHLKTAVKLKLLTSLADFEAQHNLNTL